MKVGDLVYDEHYGEGIVTKLRDDDPGAYITFIQENRQGFLPENLFDSVEVISESR
jgi:hypothetical protein